MDRLASVMPLLLTSTEVNAMISSSLEGLVNPEYVQAIGRNEYPLSQLPLNSCASNPSRDKDENGLEAQKLGGNFVSQHWTDAAELTDPDSTLNIQHNAKGACLMPTFNPNTLPSTAPLPAHCRVLSNARLVARGHNNVDDPFVPVGAVVEVVAMQPYSGYTCYARFTYEGVTCHLPITDLQELFLEDTADNVAVTEEMLWTQVHNRLSRLLPEAAECELNSLLSDIKAAGNTSAVAVVFLQSWLSRKR